MGKIIAIVNQKGGVGKTTTTVNLGACLATLDKKVLIIDADPQANASSGLGLDISELNNTIYECMLDGANPKDGVQNTSLECLKILPSHIDLVGAEIELLQVEERESVLKKVLAEIKDDYDFILIDCSPSLGMVTVNALTAADSVLIPVQAEYFALEGIAKLVNTMQIVKKKLNPSLSIEGFLITMYDPRARLGRQVIEEITRYFGEMTFQTVINRNVKLAEAPSFGQSIIEYDIESKGAQNYMQFTQEFLARNASKTYSGELK